MTNRPSTGRASRRRGDAAPARMMEHVRRVVVKVGSGVIAARGRLRPRIVATLIYDVSELRHRGYEVILVVSGAVASGFSALGMKRPPSAVLERQAAAAIGQHKMMAMFARVFAQHRTEVGQLLMSADDIENRRRFISARHTLGELLARGIVPIINENDALSDHEAIIGDNDHLSALVTNVASAQLLVILSRVAGVYEDGSAGRVIPRVEVGSDIARHITRELSESGVGGMIAKVSAARLASHWGVPTIIADGTQAGALQRIVGGEEIGTMFVPREKALSARKRWIAFRSRSRGALRVDAGAAAALRGRGASLLPTGIVDVRGQFPMGSRIDIVDHEGVAFAVGLASYTADEIRSLRGRKKADIRDALGYEYTKEVVHRDDLVILE